jgi:hypothetical protein
MTQVLTFAVTEIFIPNQVATIAVDPIPTIVDLTSVAVVTSAVNPADAPLVVEAIVTTPDHNVVAVASCRVHHLVIAAVVPHCIAILHIFVAITTSAENPIHPTLAAVVTVFITKIASCAAMHIYAPNRAELHAVEQLTTIPLLVFAVATICCQNLKVPLAVVTRTTIQASKSVAIALQMVDITSFKNLKAVNDTISTTNGHGHLLSYKIFCLSLFAHD